MSKWTKTRDPRIKRRGGDTLWLRFSKKKIRVEESLDTDKWDFAVDIANRVEQAILSGEDYKKVLNPTVEDLQASIKFPLIRDLFPLHLLDITNGNPKKKIKKLRAKTIAEKTNYWDRYFEPFFGNLRIDEIAGAFGLDLWEKYIEFARNKSEKKDKLKIFNHWKHFSAFLSWCEIMGHFKGELTRPEIYNPDETTFQEQIENEEDGIGINFTDAQLKAFRDGAANFVKDPSKSDKLYPEFHLYVMMAQFMGMRSSEITQLHKTRLKITEGMISLRKSDTKTKEARTFAIHPEVMPFILAQIERSGESPYLFPNRWDKERPMDTTGFKKPWGKLREQLGIEGRFHDFRHSYASRVFAMPGINPVVVCKAIGMSMKVAMEHYIHFTEDQLSSLNSFKMGDGENGEMTAAAAPKNAVLNQLNSFSMNNGGAPEAPQMGDINGNHQGTGRGYSGQV